MKALLTLSLLLLLATGALHAELVDVLPARVSEGAVSLNGAWPFKYVPSLNAGADENFYQPSFDVSAWKKIPVPSHWELEGYTEPQYADDVKEGTGLYRRTFQVAPEWRGQRVFLRFDGVLYGFTAYVNGQPVGEWASSYNPATFDITDALSPDRAENVLAVRVTTRSKGWNFDNMDCWALSGIFRDVTLFARPALYLRDYTARTTLRADGAAEWHLETVASGAGTLAGRLLAPGGTTAKAFSLELSADGRGATDLVIEHPQLWTAETPSLYRLELDLKARGKTPQHFSDRIGLRQITTDGGLLKLNGVPIKLRGVDHHDIWPEAGRVATEERMRRDLELIRDANINFIRTSHYPPHPRFLELCDEMGIYVDDEVPYIHGRKDLKNPAFQETLFTRARATVMRDKNRPCVIFWSCGNENPVTELGNKTGEYVKSLDPSRPYTFPTIGSAFMEYVEKFPASMELYAAHYPSPKVARQLAEKLERPIVFTEYAHQRGLARGGTAVQDLWELFCTTPRIAGGAIWLFQDQGLLRTTTDRQSVRDADLMVWLDEHRYYDTHGFFAMDGLVYSDRTPQVDYWQVRKVYSPVQIREKLLSIKPGAQRLSLAVENRHDFRSLAGLKLHWSTHRDRAALQEGDIALGAKAKETEAVSLDVSLPAQLGTDVFTLELRVLNEAGRQLYERSIRLDTGSAETPRWKELEASLAPAPPSLEVTDAAILIRTPDYQLKLDRPTGHLALLSPAGDTIVSAFGPHMGRNPTINDLGKTREKEPEIWRGSLLREATEIQTAAREVPEGIELSVSATYPRPLKPAESISGGYKLLVATNGRIDVSYSYVPNGATGEVLEAGFALAAPAAQSEFRWLGQGPYAGYPGKDRLNEYGAYHLNRADLYFPGNRREVELASLAGPSGAGVLLRGKRMTLDLENLDATTILSHLALVPGDKNGSGGKGENVEPSSRIKAPSIKTIDGRFTLLPLGSAWPAPLMRWLGAPGDRVEINKPFLHSYDQ